MFSASNFFYLSSYGMKSQEGELNCLFTILIPNNAAFCDLLIVGVLQKLVTQFTLQFKQSVKVSA